MKTIILLALLPVAVMQSSSVDPQGCTALLQRQSIILAITQRIPMSDGSVMKVEEGGVSETLMNVFKNNMNAMGMQSSCNETVCDISPGRDGVCADVLVAAIMGNFLNHDLENDDSLAKITIDIETGLLRREKAKLALRSVFIDFLLILTIVMLVKRANDDNEIRG